MPRAVIPDRLQPRMVQQSFAAALRDVTGSISIVGTDLQLLADEVPPNLAAKLDNYEARLDDLENPPA